jgi:hypothetical protein
MEGEEADVSDRISAEVTVDQYNADDLLEPGRAQTIAKESPVALLNALNRLAGCITRETPLGPDESWHDPQNWQTEAIALAHGFRAYYERLQIGRAWMAGFARGPDKSSRADQEGLR